MSIITVSDIENTEGEGPFIVVRDALRIRCELHWNIDMALGTYVVFVKSFDHMGVSAG